MPDTRDTRSIFSDAGTVSKVSPMTRIPGLVPDDGKVLIDSTAILDHLDEAGNRALFPASGPRLPQDPAVDRFGASDV